MNLNLEIKTLYSSDLKNVIFQDETKANTSTGYGGSYTDSNGQLKINPSRNQLVLYSFIEELSIHSNTPTKHNVYTDTLNPRNTLNSSDPSNIKTLTYEPNNDGCFRLVTVALELYSNNTSGGANNVGKYCYCDVIGHALYNEIVIITNTGADIVRVDINNIEDYNKLLESNFTSYKYTYFGFKTNSLHKLNQMSLDLVNVNCDCGKPSTNCKCVKDYRDLIMLAHLQLFSVDRLIAMKYYSKATLVFESLNSTFIEYNNIMSSD